MKNSATTPELLRQLDSNDPDVVAAAACELGSRHEASATPQLLERLRTTDNSLIRNAAALALSDMKEPQAFNVLVTLLRDERTRKSRGTLLHALGAYDCSPLLPLLVDLVIDGNFEVSRQAFSLIQGIETEIDEREWRACTTRLREAWAAASSERPPLIAELLALFEEAT